MLKCLYGTRTNKIDVTDIVLNKYYYNGIIKIDTIDFDFFDIAENETKTLTIQTAYFVYTVDKPMIIPLIFHCEYGANNVYINVTDLVLKNYDNMVIPNGNKHFNNIFGDPCPGLSKELLIYSNNKKYKIPEYDVNMHFIEITDYVKDYMKKLQNKETLITFIIPTINRPTLMNTLYSLLNQKSKEWKAICIFDNVSPNKNVVDLLNSDKRFSYYVLNKKLGKDTNSAGLVRNYGIEKADTKWIGFVDDDDTLLPHYVDSFKEEVNRNDLDCIIFRMIFEKIMPQGFDKTFYCNYVGISFCYKKELFNDGYQFIPSSGEDFNLLDRMRSNSKKMLMSDRITYKVRGYNIVHDLETVEKHCLKVLLN